MGTVTAIKGAKGTRYRAQVRRKGHPQQSEYFARRKDAEAWVRKIETELDAGRFLFDGAAKKRTVSELIDRYEADVLPQKKSARDQRQQLSIWREMVGQEKLLGLSTATLMEARRKIAERQTRHDKPVSNATVNRYLAVFSHVLTVAENQYQWIPENPMRRVPLLKEAQGRDRVLSNIEIQRLLAACSEIVDRRLEVIVLLALTSAMRRGEIMGLTWDRVFLDQGLLKIEEPKNGQRRMVTVLPEVVAKMAELDVDGGRDGLVFPNKTLTGAWDFKKSWQKVLQQADLDDFRFHDLRHTAAKLIAKSGGSVPQIATILGHKSFKMASRYAHLTEDHTRDLLSRTMKEVLPDE
ncbi:tyrosine-type recombinase/integrase [Pseudaestuariivita atlantica]|uniref:Integrase n=1 Tax=Pseudaestuariivita atlantica TaxID=1317121 RepID=A0A0L1JTF0_9RHOB|nr:site-specific integrase [Pseudaestuariivita atlantica]KNG95020.1 hypothetical protein ATO11_06580 [Pseudaestuariivita atlantica]